MNSNNYYCNCFSENVCICSEEKKVRRFVDFENDLQRFRGTKPHSWIQQSKLDEYITPIKSHVAQTFFMLKLSDFPVEKLSVLMCKILSELECRFTCKDIPLKETCGFSQEAFEIDLEYGTLPKEKTLAPYQLSTHEWFTKRVLLDCMKKATDMFPANNAEDGGDEENNIPSPVGLRGRSLWCKSEIRISFDTFTPEYIVVEVLRKAGERWTNNFIYRHLIDRLNQELIWYSRFPYLSIMKGCEDERGHIVNYLFDFYAAYDICTFMELPDKVATALPKHIRQLHDYHMGLLEI